MFKIIAIILVMVVINAFMVYAIFTAAKRVNEKVNKYFLNNISEIVPVPNNSEQESNTEADSKKEIIYEQVPVFKVDTEKETALYRNNSFKENYKSIKEKMSFDTKEVIKDVIDSTKNEANETAQVAIELAKQFDIDMIFNLNTLSSIDQEDILRKSFNEYQILLLEDFKRMNNKQFSCVEFFEYVNRIAKQEDPTFYVKTGWKEDYYDNLDKNVVTVHDESITEGVKIVHKDKIYDYSI